MIKFKLQISVLAFLFLHLHSFAQERYRLFVRGVDKDSTFLADTIGIPSSFANRKACSEFVNLLPGQLKSKGYVTASMDSLRFDSTHADMVLFVGDRYRWTKLDASQVDVSLLRAIGWRENMFNDHPLDVTEVQLWQDRMLNYLENNGYPFAKVSSIACK